MKTLESIQANPKTNVWGSLGSRNRVPATVNVVFDKGTIWCVTSKDAIYSAGEFNETVELKELPEAVLIQINNQLNVEV